MYQMHLTARLEHQVALEASCPVAEALLHRHMQVVQYTLALARHHPDSSGCGNFVTTYLSSGSKLYRLRLTPPTLTTERDASAWWTGPAI